LSPAIDALNHLLRQNAWAADRLRPYAGKTIRINLPLFAVDATLVEGGHFVPAVENAQPEATITLPPTEALHFLATRELDTTAIALEGDMELATTVGKVLRQLEWEYEEDLSRVIGDIPAHQLVNFGKRMVSESKRQLHALGAMFADYWQEEQPLIAKQRHLDTFSREVDLVRDDIARLTKRIEKLEKPH